jgi:hypothetical protein
MKKFCLLLSWLFSCAFATSAFSQVDIFEKQQIYVQTSAAAPAPYTQLGPYLFAVQAAAAGTLTPPGLASQALVYNSNKTDYEASGSFSTKVALDARYPNGNYKLAGGSFPTVTVNVSGDLYPVAPQVTNGTWQNNVLVIDPTQSYTLNFNTFTTYGSSGVGSYEGFQISSESGNDNVNIKQDYATIPVAGATVSTTPFTSYTLPAHTLTAGLPYRIQLQYFTVTSVDTTTIPGTTVVGGYMMSLVVYVVGKYSPSITPPTITTQPANQGVVAGTNATFSPTITYSGSGTSPYGNFYLWWFIDPNFGPTTLNPSSKYVLFGGTQGALTINAVAASDAGNYFLEAINGGGLALSQTVTLSLVTAAPSITTQPASVSLNAGASGTLSVSATNAASYQWQLNGANIPGATNSSLTGTNIGTTQRGNYTVVVSNALGSVTSNPASVAVSVNSYLYNISTYGYVGSGTGQDLDAGYFIYGSGTKNILVMGAGPNLSNATNGGSAAFAGLALAAPELTFDGVYPSPTSTLGTNAAWGGGQTLTNAIKAVYAPVFLSNSNDTAITQPVTVNGSNGYTVDVTINSGGPGLALVEVDDVDSFKALPTIAPSSYLANISTRGYVGASGGSGSGTGIGQYEYLDAGFTLFGTTSQTLLIRAVGPSLNGAPAPTLAKPKLTLYDVSGNVIATNSGWGTAPVPGNSTVAAGIQQATTAIMNSVYASTITPGSADCAMVVTLPSGTGGQGAYTATVTSADNTSTGLALVEVYNIP